MQRVFAHQQENFAEGCADNEKTKNNDLYVKRGIYYEN